MNYESIPTGMLVACNKCKKLLKLNNALWVTEETTIEGEKVRKQVYRCNRCKKK